MYSNNSNNIPYILLIVIIIRIWYTNVTFMNGMFYIT